MHVLAFTPHQCSFVHTQIHDDSYINDGHDWLHVFCLDINECENNNPCSGNSECINHPGLFNCECNAGYGGPDCIGKLLMNYR